MVFDSSLVNKTILLNIASDDDGFAGIDDIGNIYDENGPTGVFSSTLKASILWNFFDASTVSLCGGNGGPVSKTYMLVFGISNL